MSNTAAQAKLRFLEASARHYVSSAPEISAHLMAQRNAEIAENGLSVDKSPVTSSCKACGTLLVPGWTSKTSIIGKGKELKGMKVEAKKVKNDSKHSAKKRSNRKSSSDGSIAQKYLRVDCLVCYRYEKTPLQGANIKSTRSLKASCKPALAQAERPLPPSQDDVISTISASQAQTAKPPSTNISSKKRAKARKQGGLQAMLEKSKALTASSSGFGLDLLDLMKQG